jgi:hypothetical protein
MDCGALLPSGLYLYCLDCISTVWIVSRLSGLYLYRLDCISTVWIVSLLSGLYLDCLDCISTVWIVSRLSGLYLYRLDCASTVESYFYHLSRVSTTILLFSKIIISTGGLRRSNYLSRTSTVESYFYCRLLLLSGLYLDHLSCTSTTCVATLLLESHFYHSSRVSDVLLFSK